MKILTFRHIIRKPNGIIFVNRGVISFVFSTYLCHMKQFFQSIEFKRENYPWYVMLLFVFAIPLCKKAIVPLGILFFITLLFSLKKEMLRKRLSTNTPLLLSIAYYLIFAIGLLWTENMKCGIFDLELKLSFLFFPVMFYMLPFQIERRKMKIILKAFVAGSFVAILICLIHATIAFIKLPVVYYTFVSSRLSFLHHPTYFAMFLNFSLIIILVWKRQNKIKDIPVILLSAIIAFFNWLLMSRAGIGTTLIILFVFWVSLFFEKKYKSAIISLLVFAIVSLIAVNTSKYTMQRLRKTEVLVKEITAEPKTQPAKSIDSGSRFVIWKSALNAIRLQPIIGAGTGDVHSVMDQYYSENDMDIALEKSLNAHNQFLQSWVAVGIIGFLLIIAMFVAGFIRNKKNKDLIGAGFLMVCFLTMLIESTLETQSGIVFFSFFYALFLTYRSDEE